MQRGQGPRGLSATGPPLWCHPTDWPRLVPQEPDPTRGEGRAEQWSSSQSSKTEVGGAREGPQACMGSSGEACAHTAGLPLSTRPAPEPPPGPTAAAGLWGSQL